MADKNGGELHVVFGTGPVGLAVTEELVARGKQVRVVNRSGRAILPQGVEIAKGDAANPERTGRALPGSRGCLQLHQPTL